MTEVKLKDVPMPQRGWCYFSIGAMVLFTFGLVTNTHKTLDTMVTYLILMALPFWYVGRTLVKADAALTVGFRGGAPTPPAPPTPPALPPEIHPPIRARGKAVRPQRVEAVRYDEPSSVTVRVLGTNGSGHEQRRIVDEDNLPRQKLAEVKS